MCVSPVSSVWECVYSHLNYFLGRERGRNSHIQTSRKALLRAGADMRRTSLPAYRSGSHTQKYNYSTLTEDSKAVLRLAVWRRCPTFNEFPVTQHCSPGCFSCEGGGSGTETNSCRHRHGTVEVHGYGLPCRLVFALRRL